MMYNLHIFKLVACMFAGTKDYIVETVFWKEVNYVLLLKLRTTWIFTTINQKGSGGELGWESFPRSLLCFTVFLKTNSLFFPSVKMVNLYESFVCKHGQ